VKGVRTNLLIKLTSVTSLDAAAALMCKLGCFTELLQSRALANVPTDLHKIEKQLIHNETLS